MRTLDLNADLGEMDTPDGHASDAAILSVVTSASIACGGHAGDADTMARAVGVAMREGVRIGAHPAYPDREGFGRRPRFKIAHDALAESLAGQVASLMEVARAADGRVAYVKPHGALYNDAVVDAELAELVVGVVEDIGVGLALMGAPNSEVEAAAEGRLRFIPEGFIDRRYSDAGHLVPRGREGAVLATDEGRLAQLERLAVDRAVITDTGAELPVACRTLCLHGDSAGAMRTARLARDRLLALGVRVEA